MRAVAISTPPPKASIFEVYGVVILSFASISDD